MKTVKQIVLSLALLITMNSYGQQIISAAGDTIVSVNSGGVISNMNNQVYGKILSDGIVLDSQDQQVGSVVGNYIKDNSNVILGNINVIDSNKLEVLDASNNLIGTFQYGVMFMDENNQLLMNITEPIEFKKFAAFYFFFNN